MTVMLVSHYTCVHANPNGHHQVSGLLGVFERGQLLRWYNEVYTNSVMMIRSK